MSAVDLPAAERGDAQDLADLARDAFLCGRDLPDPMAMPGAKAYALTERFSLGGPAVLALGTFDGVHRGHRRLVECAADDARQRGVPLVIVTFDPDPSQVLAGPSPASLLLSSRDRLLALSHLPADAIIAFDFTRDFANLGYEEFVTDRLLSLLRPLAIHVGSDFALGRGREGSIGALEVLLGALGISAFGHELRRAHGAAISATRIRALLVAGEVELAMELLGRAPFVSGVVAHGRGEGSSLGFPTANVRFDRAFAFPEDGVYAGICGVGERSWPAAVNIGEPPSYVEGDAASDVGLAEASLIGFSGDLYGRDVSVALVKRLRPSVRFEGVGELQAAVRRNLDETRRLLGSAAFDLGHRGWDREPRS